ncbi:MAG: transposase [Bacteroidota bacterium]
MQEQMSVIPDTPIQRLSRDLRQAAATLSDDEARFIVDAYYIQQKDRIRMNNATKALERNGKPHSVIKYLTDQAEVLENQLKAALDRYSLAHEIGIWVRSLKGIGPVFAAGLMAHIDITRCPTAGAVWQFAGLNPNSVWHKGEWVADTYANASKTHGKGWPALIEVCRSMGKRPLHILHEVGAIESIPSVEDARSVVEELEPETYAERCEFHADRVLLAMQNPVAGYERLIGKFEFDEKPILANLKKRPWNADLKRLLFLVGESFVKVSGGDDPSPYGILYKERKEREIAKNEAGDFAPLAQRALTEKRYGVDTTARAYYEKGLLPPARIHLRAKRFAVKRFLSDYHLVAYWMHYKRLPPAPYILSVQSGQAGQHAHYDVVIWDSLPKDLQEALDRERKPSRKSA